MLVALAFSSTVKSVVVSTKAGAVLLETRAVKAQSLVPLKPVKTVAPLSAVKAPLSMVT
jgi:hypothetical protein